MRFAYSANITPDPDTGIGRWTDPQIMTAIREPDGTHLKPPMGTAYCNRLSPTDQDTLVRYLRSLQGQ